MKRKLITAGVLLALLLSLWLPAIPAQAAKEPEIEAASAVVMDATTGEILWSKDADTVRPAASMTKVMAAWLVYEAIHDGRTTLETPVPVSSDVYAFSRDEVYSNIPFQTDEVYTVEDMLEAFLCYSACAAGPALGELLYGSEENFVAAMNAKAWSLGLDAWFDQSYDEGYLSARDMAVLSRQVIDECPEILDITRRSQFEFGGKTYDSSNDLLKNDNTAIGLVDGLKTGWTPEAGSCMAATSTKDGTRLIAVSMKAKAVNARYRDGAALLRYGYDVLDARRAAGYTYATPHTAGVTLNGAQLGLHAYLANGNNYVRLRDFAAVLNGTGAQFGLEYDGASGIVSIQNGSAYNGTLDVMPSNGATVMSQLCQPVLNVDGQPYAIDAYLIDGFNYMKLRDLADVVGCGIDWDAATGMVVLLP